MAPKKKNNNNSTPTNKDTTIQQETTQSTDAGMTVTTTTTTTSEKPIEQTSETPQTDYAKIANEVVAEHNKLITNPTTYIPLLEEQMKYFKDNNILIRPGEAPIQTNEGKKAYEEAVEFLKTAKALKPLENSEKLAKSANDHVNDIGTRGAASHESADGKNVSDRIEKYIEWEGVCGENIEFGFKKAEDVIINLLVDDGMSDRPHRRHMFNEKFHHFGVAAGAHKAFDLAVVIDYVSNVREMGTHPSEEHNSPMPKRTEGKKMNDFQYDDADAPDDCESVNIKKSRKTIDGDEYQVNKKTYLLKDGTTHIVEVVEKIIAPKSS